MSEPTRDDLRVYIDRSSDGWDDIELGPITDDEFDHIARSLGYIKPNEATYVEILDEPTIRALLDLLGEEES